MAAQDQKYETAFKLYQFILDATEGIERLQVIRLNSAYQLAVLIYDGLAGQDSMPYVLDQHTLETSASTLFSIFNFLSKVQHFYLFFRAECKVHLPADQHNASISTLSFRFSPSLLSLSHLLSLSYLLYTDTYFNLEEEGGTGGTVALIDLFFQTEARCLLTFTLRLTTRTRAHGRFILDAPALLPGRGCG